MTAAGPRSILVVDDSPLMRRLITEIVEADPDLRVVDVAENGMVALQKARQHHPDCILLDLEMPELSGLDTLRRLRLRSPAKIVILSYLGHEGARVRAQALRLGAVDVIDKPSAAVSPDLRTTRGSIIQQTLRRVLGLPAVHVSTEPLSPGGALATASLLSVHVHQLASLYERVDAATLVGHLNAHLARVDEVVRKHGGILDAQVGGAALFAFGVPTRHSDHAARALAAADELREGLATGRAAGPAAGGPSLDVGLAIASGLVLAGELGPPGTRHYRTMSDALEIAARLGRATEAYGVELVVCGRTLAALGAAVRSRRLDLVQLEPDGESIEVHEVLSARSDLDAATLDAYARGLGLFEAGDLARAIRALDEVLQRRPMDRAATRLLARCHARLGAPAVARRPPFEGAGGAGGTGGDP